MRFILALSLSFSITLAQNNNPPGNNSTATTPASPALQTVTVGKDSTNKFDPDSLTVSAGSKVVFEFYPGHHSVVQGTFNKPCSPLSNVAFFSGYVDINNGSAVGPPSISLKFSSQIILTNPPPKNSPKPSQYPSTTSIQSGSTAVQPLSAKKEWSALSIRKIQTRPL